MRNLFLALLLLAAPAAFGQSPKETSQRVRAIQQQVRAIGHDSLRRVDFSQAMLPPDTVRRLHINLFQPRYVACYAPDGQLQELLVGQMDAHYSSSSTKYYFVQGEVVYVDTDYVNGSRMGSCGQVHFHNRYYVVKGQLLDARLSGPPKDGPFYYCYGPVIPGQELARLLQEVQPALAKVPPYRVEK